MEQPAEPVATVDLDAVASLERFVLEILNPSTGKPLGWKITLAGPSHPATRALALDASRDALRRAQAIEAAQINGRKFKPDDEDAADRHRRNVTSVCRRIESWSPNPVFPRVGPRPIAFSLEAAVDLFMRPELGGVFVQITDYLTSERAFMQPSGTT